MINRTMVRTRVMQTLFAYYTDGEKTPSQARKELVKSFSDTYNLYMMLLALADELTTYAQNQIAEQEQRAKITHQKFTPNRRFADNSFAAQVFQNRTLRRVMDAGHLTWDAGLNAMPALFKKLQEQYYYQFFMEKEQPTYEEEKELWKKIYSMLLPDNEDLITALEEMEVCLDQQNWETDLNVVLSYVVKTIKRFSQDNGADQPLLEMFDSEDELQFAQQLLEQTIAHKPEYDKTVEEHLKNWDMERIPLMDRVLLVMALTELNQFPEIAHQVSLNEYIELAKEYSSDKSYVFINGILDEILKEQNN
ncbi:MAG: transcription antitermination factor NusB [Paludibacteraceae bacterium]|nr:transcription antitermination factor NusB [Paludibacteraceae bacterium]